MQQGIVVEKVPCCAFTSLKLYCPNNTKKDDNNSNIKAEMQASTIIVI
jgi:hypothetical protein